MHTRFQHRRYKLGDKSKILISACNGVQANGNSLPTGGRWKEENAPERKKTAKKHKNTKKKYPRTCACQIFFVTLHDFWWQSHVKALKWSLRDVKALKWSLRDVKELKWSLRDVKELKWSLRDVKALKWSLRDVKELK